MYTVRGEKPSEEQVDKMIESGESETIFQQAILEQGRGRVRPQRRLPMVAGAQAQGCACHCMQHLTAPTHLRTYAHACQTQLMFCKLVQAIAAALCATIADSNCAYDAALGVCSNGRTAHATTASLGQSDSTRVSTDPVSM